MFFLPRIDEGLDLLPLSINSYIKSLRHASTTWARVLQPTRCCLCIWLVVRGSVAGPIPLGGALHFAAMCPRFPRSSDIQGRWDIYYYSDPQMRSSSTILRVAQ